MVSGLPGSNGPTLRQKTISGVAWTTLSQIARQGLGFVVSVVLARLLTPADFGLVAMIAVFTGFAALFGELGFGAALIQREAIEDRHTSSIFWLNIAVGIFLTVLFAAGAPLIAAFYKEPRLKALTMLMSLNFSINALNLVQNALLSRAMNFRLLAKVEILALAVGGATAIVLALLGFGVWSLALQMLVSSTVAAAALWILTRWRPRLLFDWPAVRDLLGFSSSLLGSNVLGYWYGNLDKLLIGKYINTAGLGIYTRGQLTAQLLVGQVSGTLSRVLYPALASIQSEKARVKSAYLRLVAMIALIAFPAMAGLFVVADHFVLALFGPQWEAVISILRIFCLIGVLTSVASTVGLIYQSQGRTDWMLYWTSAAIAIRVLAIVIGVWWGSIFAVAASYLIAVSVLLIPSFSIPGRLIGMRFADVARSLTGVLGCSALMACGTYVGGLAIPAVLPHWAHLALQVPAGIVFYLVLVRLFKLASYREAIVIFQEFVRGRSGNKFFRAAPLPAEL